MLFLDELPEMRRDALEALREPLETGRVVLARAGHSLQLPASFQLVCAMNPCPCGYRGHPRRGCRCTPHERARYLRRISGPLLDRVELRVELAAPSVAELTGGPAASGVGKGGDDPTGPIERAHGRQLSRGAGPNARLEADALDEHVPLTASMRRLLEELARRRGLSARAVQGLRRVARTLADLEGAKRAGAGHLAEAVGLRAPLEADD